MDDLTNRKRMDHSQTNLSPSSSWIPMVYEVVSINSIIGLWLPVSYKSPMYTHWMMWRWGVGVVGGDTLVKYWFGLHNNTLTATKMLMVSVQTHPSILISLLWRGVTFDDDRPHICISSVSLSIGGTAFKLFPTDCDFWGSNRIDKFRIRWPTFLLPDDHHLNILMLFPWCMPTS